MASILVFQKSSNQNMAIISHDYTNVRQIREKTIITCSTDMFSRFLDNFCLWHWTISVHGIIPIFVLCFLINFGFAPLGQPPFFKVNFKTVWSTVWTRFPNGCGKFHFMNSHFLINFGFGGFSPPPFFKYRL